MYTDQILLNSSSYCFFKKVLISFNIIAMYIEFNFRIIYGSDPFYQIWQFVTKISSAFFVLNLHISIYFAEFRDPIIWYYLFKKD